MLTEFKNGNVVTIRGKINELDFKDVEYNKNGTTVKAIAGTVYVRVNQDNEDLIVPVAVFTNEYNSKGEKSRLYTDWMNVRNNGKSVKAFGLDGADRIECSGGRIGLREYPGRDEKLHTYTEISANFCTLNPRNTEDEATWAGMFVIGGKRFTTDADGIEDKNRYEIRMMIPKFNGEVIPVTFLAVKPEVIDVVSQYWTENSTVRAMGKVRFTQATEMVSVPSDFGEERKTPRTVRISELIVTGGNKLPLEDDMAYNVDDVRLGYDIYKKRIAAREQEIKDKASSKSAAPASSASSLGFE